MDEITKELAVQKYLELKASLCKQPSFADFKKAKTTGISRRNLEKLFGPNTWSKLVQAAGDQTDTFIKLSRSSEDYFDIYAKAVREQKGHPAEVTWNFHKYKPSVSSYVKKFKRPWSNLPDLFRQFAKDKAQYQETLSYLPVKPVIPMDSSKVDTPSSDLSRFIPPTLIDLNDFKGSDKDFEARVQDAFQILGFKVIRLGLPNEPDGVAKLPINDYAIIFDAKSHEDGYSVTAGDRRAAVEYIKNWKTSLNNDGAGTLFFAFVARNFTADSTKNIGEIRNAANVTTILLPASTLANLAIAHIRDSYDFDHDILKKIFSKGGLIDPKEIRSLLDIQTGEEGSI